MLEGLIDLYIFRDWLTNKQKWFFIIFYLVTGLILLVGYFIIICLKLFIFFLRLLNSWSQ